MKKSIVVSDIHFPNHDPIAIKVFEEVCADLEPDEIILNGDILDLQSLSGHGDSLFGLYLDAELGPCKEFLMRLREAHPYADIIYLEGNHEDRFKRFLKKQAPQLVDLPGFSIEELLGLDELGIAWIDHEPDQMYWITDKLAVHHGFAHGVHYAAETLRKVNTSIIVGHAHRPQYTTQPTIGPGGQHVRGCWGSGCLTFVDRVSYMRQPTGWTQGFTVVYSVPEAAEPTFSVYPVNMHRHKVIFNGKLYSG